MLVRATRAFADVRRGQVFEVDPDGPMSGYLRLRYLVPEPVPEPEPETVEVEAPTVTVTAAPKKRATRKK